MAEYNGWKNRQTWNVALWFNNDEGLYNLSKRFNSYKELAQAIVDSGSQTTGDGVSWLDPELDYQALDEAVMENHV